MREGLYAHKRCQMVIKSQLKSFSRPPQGGADSEVRFLVVLGTTSANFRISFPMRPIQFVNSYLTFFGILASCYACQSILYCLTGLKVVGSIGGRNIIFEFFS